MILLCEHLINLLLWALGFIMEPYYVRGLFVQGTIQSVKQLVIGLQGLDGGQDWCRSLLYFRRWYIYHLTALMLTCIALTFRCSGSNRAKKIIFWALIQLSFQICILVSNSNVLFSLLLIEMFDKHFKILSLVVLDWVIKRSWVAFHSGNFSFWVAWCRKTSFW